MDRLSQWIDDHLRLVRIIPWLIGGIGTYLLVKHTHVFRHFKNISDISQVLIQHNSQLSGQVIKCFADSLGVWHVPLGNRLLRWKTNPPSVNSDLLHLQFAGIIITKPERTHQWFKGNLINQFVQFTLLHNEGDAIKCIIYAKRKGLLRHKFSINEALVTAGLATVTDAKGFHSNKQYVSFMTSLTRCELQAQKKGVGMWAGSDYESWTRKVLRTFRKNNKNI